MLGPNRGPPLITFQGPPIRRPSVPRCLRTWHSVHENRSSLLKSEPRRPTSVHITLRVGISRSVGRSEVNVPAVYRYEVKICFAKFCRKRGPVYSVGEPVPTRRLSNKLRSTWINSVSAQFQCIKLPLNARLCSGSCALSEFVVYRAT